MDIEKCKKCIWCHKINKKTLFCIFPNGIKQEKKNSYTFKTKEND